jgi:hypothetical protein
MLGADSLIFSVSHHRSERLLDVPACIARLTFETTWRLLRQEDIGVAAACPECGRLEVATLAVKIAVGIRIADVQRGVLPVVVRQVGVHSALCFLKVEARAACMADFPLKNFFVFVGCRTLIFVFVGSRPLKNFSVFVG